MYIIINSDQSINAIVKSLDHTCDSQCECIELTNQNRETILNNIPLEEALWDADCQTVIRDPYFVVGSEDWRKRKASDRINAFYPLSKQLNLLRSGDKSAIKAMSIFIDKCRKWSNDSTIAVDILDRLVP